MFANGASCALSAACALFFFRFWSRAGDRLFMIFGGAFSVLAFERLIFLVIFDPQTEARAFIYLLRLFAFLLIVGGIWDKNRAREDSAYGA
jgi:hypothetical protein